MAAKDTRGEKCLADVDASIIVFLLLFLRQDSRRKGSEKLFPIESSVA
jgi:hypothetical protein